MLRIISCHGQAHERETVVHDFIAIIEINEEELKYRPLTGSEIMRFSKTPIASLTCFGENEALTALANKIYPILRHTEGADASVTLLQRLFQGAIDLYRQPRLPAFLETESEQQATA